MNGWNRLFIVFSLITFVLIMLFAFSGSDITPSHVLLKLATPHEILKTGELVKSGDDCWVLHTKSNGVEYHELELILKRAGFTEDMLRSSIQFHNGRRQWLNTEKHYEKVKNASMIYFIERFLKKTSIEYFMIWGGLVATVYLIVWRGGKGNKLRRKHSGNQ